VSRSGTSGQANAGDADTRAVVREAEQIAAEAVREADATAGDAERTTEATGSAPVEEAATAAAREVTASSELLANLVSEFASGISDEPGSNSLTNLVDRLRNLLSEGRGALRGYREMSRRIAALQDSVEEVEDDRDQVRARLEEEQLDHAETQSELLDAKAEADRLRAALAQGGRADEAWTVAAAAPQPPGSFDELLERLDEDVLPNIVFTGETKSALELDEYDPLGTWASKTWDMLRVLEGYANARLAGEFAQGVHAYLTHTPPGRPGYSPGSHASQESDSVAQSPKFSRMRTLPVPSEVDPDGLIFMGAHFRIARRGLISPRMHYHDDTAKTGKIYIGYIGKHLPNTQTN
jgi:F0F1-type ATP synthase membrane subunit b/b'